MFSLPLGITLASLYSEIQSSSEIVNTQYLVNIFNNVCLVKKVLAKSIKSVIPLFF